MQVTQPAIPHRDQNQLKIDILPPKSLIPVTISSAFPSEAPILTRERAWISGKISNLLQNTTTLSSKHALTQAFQYLHELGRHFFNFHKIPSSDQNPLLDLVVCQIKLSEKIYEELTVQTYDPGDHENGVKNTNKQFNISVENSKLQMELSEMTAKFNQTRQGLIQKQFDNQDLNKKMLLLNQEIQELKQQLQESKLEKQELMLKLKNPVHAYLQTQSYSKNISDRPQSQLLTDRSAKNDFASQQRPPRPKSVFSNSLQNKQVSSPVREFISPDQQQSQLNLTNESALTKQFASKFGDQHGQENLVISATQQRQKSALASQMDAAYDNIQPVSRVDTTRVSQQQTSFSRIQQASQYLEEDRIADAARMTDTYQYGENFLYNKYALADVANLMNVEYNEITRDAVLKKYNLEQDRLQTAVLRITDTFNKQIDDNAYLAEQAIIDKYDHPLNICDEVYSVCRLEIKQPAKIITQKLNPLFDEKAAEFYYSYNQTKIVDETGSKPKTTYYSSDLLRPRFINKQKNVLESIWSVGGLGQLNELIYKLTNVNHQLTPQYPDQKQQKGKSDKSKNHTQESLQFYLQKDNLIAEEQQMRKNQSNLSEQQEQLQQVSETTKYEFKTPKLLQQYIQRNPKESPFMYQLIQFYINETLQTKNTQFNLIGIKTKPTTTLSKIINQDTMNELIKLLKDDKEFQKELSDNVLKKYQNFYKNSQLQPTTTTQITEKHFGLEIIRKQLKKQSFILFEFTELVSIINDLINKYNVIVQNQICQNVRFVNQFSKEVYSIIFNDNQQNKQQTDKFICSLMFSACTYCCYLDLVDELDKQYFFKIQTDEPLNINSYQNNIFFLFISMMNDFFSQQDTSFMLRAYQLIVKQAQLQNSSNYCYVDVNSASIALGQLFNLQNNLISQTLLYLLNLMQKQLQDRSYLNNNNQKIIDIGRAVHISMKTREAIVNVYLDLIPKDQLQFQKNNLLQAFQKQNTRSELFPENLYNFLVEHIYTQTIVQLQPQQQTLQYALCQSESYCLQYGYLYDAFAVLYPILQLNRIFYGATESNLQIIKGIKDTVNLVSSLLLTQGHGLTYLAVPFVHKGVKIIGQFDQKLIYNSYTLQQQLQIAKTCNSKEQFTNLVLNSIQSVLQLKYFQLSGQFQDLVEQIFNVINSYLIKHVNMKTEKESLFGIRIDEEDNCEEKEQVDLKTLMMMTRNSVVVESKK